MRILSAVTLSGVMVCCALFSAWGQNATTQTGRATLQQEFPTGEYAELEDHQQPNQAEWNATKGTKAAWGSVDCRYAKHSVPNGELNGSTEIAGWRGERVAAQAVVWSKEGVEALTFEFEPLKRGKTVLDKNILRGGFVRYVMGDQLLDGSNCGYRQHSRLDSVLVADVVDHCAERLSVEPMSVRAVWVSCDIPASAEAGIYRSRLIVKADGKRIASLPLTVKVVDKTLPKPEDWTFHLDLWQNPFAVARYYKVPLWSDEHFAAMRPLMTRLAEAGQKVITATIMHRPWGGQTEDYFETMVTWTRRVDGSWAFDFDIFDRWVAFMMDCGIKEQINCYSMIPWALSFKYFDQATNSMQVLKTAPGEPEYEQVWSSMLSSFSNHLKQKGLFEITAIAMDERSMKEMQRAMAIIAKAAPGMKVALAGNYHDQLEPNIYDYCIAIGQSYPEGVKEKRASQGKRTTIYTCCTESHPNTFTVSPLAEAAWIGFYCAKVRSDGYLRWAYNSWVKEPLLDSRFTTWTSGDCYLVYPANRTSLRFERLREGIQAWEKIALLRRQAEENNDKQLSETLESILSTFNLDDLGKVDTAQTVSEAHRRLNAIQ